MFNLQLRAVAAVAQIRKDTGAYMHASGLAPYLDLVVRGRMLIEILVQ